jgi:hypothetical protein
MFGFRAPDQRAARVVAEYFEPQSSGELKGFALFVA